MELYGSTLNMFTILLSHRNAVRRIDSIAHLGARSESSSPCDAARCTRRAIISVVIAEHASCTNSYKEIKIKIILILLLQYVLQ
jgi:hypothetical protein